MPVRVILGWALAAIIIAVAAYLFGLNSSGTAPLASAASPLNSAEAQVDRSNLAYRAGQYREAIQAATAALKLKPEYALAYNNLAVSYLGLHMYDEALHNAREALRVQPNWDLAKNNLAWIQREKAKSAGLRVDPPAAPPKPGTADYYLTQSLQNYQAGSFQESIDAARQVLKIDPGSAAAYNNIAAGYASLRKWDDAIDNARKALERQPAFTLARNNLNWALTKKAEEFRAQKK